MKLNNNPMWNRWKY